MNKQRKHSGIEWTHVWGRQGYTWNPIGGCQHGCEWKMPNGEIAVCYAKTIAERFTTAYDKGFEHHYWRPHKLTEPLKVKKPSGIFLDSMSDLMGHWVPNEQIEQVLDVCRQAPWHIFFLLTKNVPRLDRFKFPENVWVGASSPPDIYKGQKLNARQQRRMLEATFSILSRVDSSVKWMSFEPLSQDYHEIVNEWIEALDWAVIGAASHGTKHFPPDKTAFLNLLNVLDNFEIPVFFKGNMQCLPQAQFDWREDFPMPTKLWIKS